MIVLDEQLLGRGLERDIAQWYRGTVRFITDLRPHTIIKDEAIPALLRRPELRTKAQRMGKIIWVTNNDMSYYTCSDRQVRTIPLTAQ
jgi:hypothetical protein